MMVYASNIKEANKHVHCYPKFRHMGSTDSDPDPVQDLQAKGRVLRKVPSDEENWDERQVGSQLRDKPRCCPRF
jgi:hypothetical protein